jgi:rfaE bifunctional protein nucleotidyltransferase chain/domain
MHAVSITHARLIEKWATGVLGRYEEVRGRPLPLPVPIRDLAERVYGLRCDVERFKGGLAGASGILIPQKRWIILNEGQRSGRASFTLAHELAHWLISGQPHHWVDHGLDHITGLRGGSDYERERRANYVAGALLMPRLILLDEVRRLGTLGDEEVTELAATFGVSRAAMRVRLGKLEDDLRETGIQPPFHDDGDRETGERPGRWRDGTRRPKAAIVKVERSIVDHHLYRRLSSLKRDCDHLYVALDGAEDDGDVLVDLDCVDGLALIEGKQFQELERMGPDDPHEGVAFHTIAGGRWLEGLVQGEWVGQGGESGVCVTFLRNEDRYQVEQRTLLDVGRFIVSPVELNNRQTARSFVKDAKESEKRVVIATGCFDLLTACHVRFLKRAKAAGDVLVVGVEDDTRIRAFKGPQRPVNTVSQRVEVLEALEFVDYTFVIPGSPKQPLKPFYTRLHRAIRADVLAVTEGDPHLEDRRDEIEAAGGELLVVSRFEDGSSTSLIRRFLAEIEYADLLLVSKQELRNYVAERQSDWRQLELPLDGCEP